MTKDDFIKQINKLNCINKLNNKIYFNTINNNNYLILEGTINNTLKTFIQTRNINLQQINITIIIYSDIIYKNNICYLKKHHFKIEKHNYYYCKNNNYNFNNLLNVIYKF